MGPFLPSQALLTVHSLLSFPLPLLLALVGRGRSVPWRPGQVDYMANSTALTVSLFHFRPLDFVTNNPLFAAAVLPNLFKELLGWKKQ